MTEAINEAWAIMMALTLAGALIMLASLALSRQSLRASRLARDDRHQILSSAPLKQ